MSNLETLHTLFDSNYQSMKGIHYNILMARQNEKQPIIYWGGLLSSYPELKEQHNTVIKNLKSIEEYCLENICFSKFSKFKSFDQAYYLELEKFLDDNDEAAPIDFIESQINILEELNTYKFIEIEFRYSTKRKLEFLNTQKKELLEAKKQFLGKKTKEPLPNFEMVYILRELGILDHLYRDGHSQKAVSIIIGKIIGKYFQESRGLLGKINFPENFGPKQQAKMKKIDAFLNSL